MSLWNDLFARADRLAIKSNSRAYRPRMEVLEDRLAPAVFVVNTIADAGAGSFRQAILDANTLAGADTINFNITGAGVKTINVLSALPTLTGVVTIAGNTQPGFAASPLIELNGAGAGVGVSGLTMKAAGSTVRALTINNFQGNGIFALGANEVVEGCFIGTNNAGSAAAGNKFHGVLISGAATNVRIGGTTAAARNIISGNSLSGVAILGTLTSANKVQGNFIGTNVGGTADLGNTLDGILIGGGSKNNIIGGTNFKTRNVVSGNDANGVNIQDAGSSGNKVQGNYVGLNSNGNSALGNALDGIHVASGAKANVIGGAVSGTGNVISTNLGSGVTLTGVGTTGNFVQGNFIGVNDVGFNLALGNDIGISITAGASSNTIGGTVTAARNDINSSNTAGVVISGAGTKGNVLQGNIIGLRLDGSAKRSNNNGVEISAGAVNNIVGGTVAGARNVISGNSNTGVRITGAGTTGNLIQGNFIGTGLTGVEPALGNGNGIVIDGAATGNTVGGTVVAARNIVSGNTTDGIKIANVGTDGNIIRGNFIGTNAAGDAALANVLGVVVLDGKNTLVGGALAGARNIISGNTANGLEVDNLTNTGTLVQGNFIGLNAAGAAPLGNGGSGVRIAQGAGGATIGGITALARNVISANGKVGITIELTNGTNNKIQGNFIGTLANGVTPAGNVLHGVLVFNGAHDNLIGGTAPGAGNLIANNGGDGVLIGSDAGFTGAAGIGNAVVGNRIFNNTSLGIDLGANDGPTANDNNDADTGPNNLLNTPTLTSAFLSGASLVLSGFINTEQNKVLRIEFFTNSSGNQGQTFLGFATVSTGTNNTVVFSTTLTVPLTVLAGQKITATATDELNNTSEFSIPLTIE